jgi:proprotein convertase subtilisin/kexin type 5
MKCYTNCLTCTGTQANNCLTCDSSSYFLNNTCYSSCPSYYNITITPTRTCSPCPNNCLTCTKSLNIC